MGTINFSFLPGNKSRPKTKCNLTFIPGFFSSIFIYIPYGNIFLEKKLTFTHHPTIPWTLQLLLLLLTLLLGFTPPHTCVLLLTPPAHPYPPVEVDLCACACMVAGAGPGARPPTGPTQAGQSMHTAQGI